MRFPYLTADRHARESGVSGAPDDAPLVFVEKARNARRITALDAAAAAQGLSPGMALADARARVPRLRAAPADPSADGRFLSRLAESCDRFTPSVALDGPHGLVLDVTGCAHLFGDEAGLHAAVMSHFRRLGVAARGAVAGTPDAARALARFGHAEIAPPGEDEAFVRPLPIAALGVDRETERALSRAGLRSVGDLAERSSVLFAARFGDALTRSLARAWRRCAGSLHAGSIAGSRCR